VSGKNALTLQQQLMLLLQQHYIAFLQELQYLSKALSQLFVEIGKAVLTKHFPHYYNAAK